MYYTQNLFWGSWIVTWEIINNFETYFWYSRVDDENQKISVILKVVFKSSLKTYKKYFLEIWNLSRISHIWVHRILILQFSVHRFWCT